MKSALPYPRKPRFELGQRVIVSSASDLASDYEGVEMVVVAIHLTGDLLDFDYTVEEVSRSGAFLTPNSKQRRHGSSDGWRCEDLSPA